MLNLSNDRELIREGMERKRLRRQARKQARQDRRRSHRQPAPPAAESSPWELLAEQGVVSTDDPEQLTTPTPTAEASGDRSRSTDQAAPLWVPLEGRPAEPTGRRIGRIALWTALGLVIALGVVTLARSAINFFTPAQQQTTASSPQGGGSEDLELAGTAERVTADYLTWTEDGRAWRSTAMAWTGLSGSSSDGWNGRGTATVTTTAVLGIDHVTSSLTVVTVQARVETATPPSLSGPGSVLASTPNALWLTLAVPLTRSESGLSVSAPPALVGAPSTIKPQPMSPTVDSEASTATKASAIRLLTSYANSDLTYVLAPGADVTGLDGAVTFQELTDWSVDQLATGSDPSIRHATATVRWQFPGGSPSQLLSTYRVAMVQIDGRWLLSSISPGTEK